jgi:hypothetical protein
MSDKIKITILPDGGIKTDNDGISAPNHTNASGFLRRMFQLAGGIVETILKPGAEAHTHDGKHYHSHENEHGGEHHHH